MLKVRVIPTLLWKDLGLVKGIAFDSWRRVGTVMPAIKVYNTREVDELILVDIEASRSDRDPDYSAISDFAAECFVPLTFGGGIRNIDQIRKVLLAGADKVSINTAAYHDPGLITQAADKFGAQCIVASIDCRKVSEGRYECFELSGKKTAGREVVTWAQEVERMGAGEILLTSIELDGTMLGYDLKLIEKVASAVKIPVIASGGCGSYDHMLKAIQSGASAVAAASIFHFTEQTPLEAKRYLSQNQIPVRHS